jgi:hypothetical protein
MNQLGIELVTQDELEFIYYKLGTAGSFKESLYDLFFKADMGNQFKMIQVWPELYVAHRYYTHPGYWENLQERFKRR